MDKILLDYRKVRDMIGKAYCELPKILTILLFPAYVMFTILSHTLVAMFVGLALVLTLLFTDKTFKELFHFWFDSSLEKVSKNQ